MQKDRSMSFLFRM